jgi:hypothetical protein
MCGFSGTHHFRSGTTATKRAWNLRLLSAPSSSKQQPAHSRQTYPTAKSPDQPFPSRLTSLYYIHRIVASPAAVEPRTHSFKRCIHLCRYPARPSSYISALCTSQQACNPTLPKLVNQLDAALFVHGQGCLQRTCIESNSIIHLSTSALFYTITSRPSTLSKQHQLYQSVTENPSTLSPILPVVYNWLSPVNPARFDRLPASCVVTRICSFPAFVTAYISRSKSKHESYNLPIINISSSLFSG